MPPGEKMFNYHGYSGPCPKPPLRNAPSPDAPFQSEVAETAYQKAKELGISMSRDEFRLILQAYITAEDKSRREYEEWKRKRCEVVTHVV